MMITKNARVIQGYGGASVTTQVHRKHELPKARASVRRSIPSYLGINLTMLERHVIKSDIYILACYVIILIIKNNQHSDRW